MKNKLSLLLLLLSHLIFSQAHRFVYEYTFKIDSLDKENITQEFMNLDVSKAGSNFYSSERYVYDSLMNLEFKKTEASHSRDIDFSKIKNHSKIGFSVSKKYPNFDRMLHTSINGDYYTVLDNEKINWTILQENSIIEGYKVQKATTYYLGRKWIAWFTNDIQIQEGPYKFYGLPGLILNISDDKNTHVFKWIGSKKYSFITPYIGNNKELVITPKKFNQLWKEYQKDPAKKIKEILSSTNGARLTVTDGNGKELSKLEIIKMKETFYKEEIKKNNNFLDLTLYK